VTISQKKWLLAGSVLLVAANGWFFYWQPAEPEYADKPVSYWLKEYCRSGQRMTWDTGRHEEAGVALRHMGTNLTPALLARRSIYPPIQTLRSLEDMVNFMESGLCG